MVRFVAHVAPCLSIALAVLACSGDDGAAPVAPPVSGPTFHEHVEPILQQHCQKCHKAGGLAPFALMTYTDARGVSAMMKRETAERRMPPWGAQDTSECKPKLPWIGDERLTDAEIKTIADWDAAGAPEGDPAKAPPPAVLETLELPNPTLTLTPRAPWVTSGSRDELRCFVIDDPAIAAGGYVRGVHVLPGNPKVVHHAAVMADPTGKRSAEAGPDGSYDCSQINMLGGEEGLGFREPGEKSGAILQAWTPGARPIDLPPNIGIHVTAGSKIILQIHYSPGGVANDPDLTRVQIRMGPEKPEYLLYMNAIGNFPARVGDDGLQPGPSDRETIEFRIPANASAHVEEMLITVPPRSPAWQDVDFRLYGLMAHMHLAGVDEKVDLVKPTGEICLLQDRWDFHWQRTYQYDAPIERLPKIKPGDKYRLRCTYDNTMANRRLGAEYRARLLQPMDLTLGEETVDEMCLLIQQILVKA
jgi:hypothetical protein